MSAKKRGLTLRGHSDDVVAITGIMDDEVDCFDEVVEIVVGSPEATQGVDAHGVRVLLAYGKRGAVWSAEIEPLDEDVGCPWPVTVQFEKYSPIVSIDCPIGTPITVKKNPS